MKKGTTYIVIITSLFNLLFFLLYCNLRMETKEIKRTDDLLIKDISEKQMQYIEAIDYSLGDDFVFMDNNGKVQNVNTVLLNNNRLVLYIDSRNCVSCWQNEIMRLNALCDSINFENRPIIIINNFSPRDITQIKKDYPFQVYSIGSHIDFVPPLTKYNVPFYFILTPDKKVCSPFFPSDKNLGNLTNMYFKYASTITQKTEDEKNLQNEGFIIKNENIDFGKISSRKKISSKFYFKNLCNKPRHLFSCQASCTCIMIDSFSNVVLPNKEGYVAFTTVKNTKGPFHHSILVNTDFTAQPLRLNLMGDCE